MIYHIGAVPVSDELYHHGIKGQKWGVRRYQNPNGTYTAAGKLHRAAQRAGEGLSKVGKVTGKALGALAKHQVDKIKRKHLWMMNDQELDDYVKRLAQEKSVKDAISSNKHSRGKQIAIGILEKGAQTVANKAFESLGNSIVARNKLADDIKYNKEMAKQTAKNKIAMDKMIDKKYRKMTKKDASSKMLRDLEKNYNTMNNTEITNRTKSIKELREAENRYRNTVNPTAYYSRGKG